MIEALQVRPGLEISAECLSVSYTRKLVRIAEDGEREVLDGVEAARRLPSAVELRCDIERCAALDAAEKARILAWKPLMADRRGVVRTRCDEYESRPKNLGGARDAMAFAIRAALEAPAIEPAAERKKRGHGGLWKPGGVPKSPPPAAPAKKRRAKKEPEPG